MSYIKVIATCLLAGKKTIWWRKWGKHPSKTLLYFGKTSTNGKGIIAKSLQFCFFLEPCSIEIKPIPSGFNAPFTSLTQTVNSRLEDFPLLRTLANTGKIQIPAKAIEVWLEMTSAITDSRYYGITDTFGATKRNILLFWLSIKRTPWSSHIT